MANMLWIRIRDVAVKIDGVVCAVSYKSMDNEPIFSCRKYLIVYNIQ
jgi:hypothetical protein